MSKKSKRKKKRCAFSEVTFEEIKSDLASGCMSVRTSEINKTRKKTHEKNHYSQHPQRSRCSFCYSYNISISNWTHLTYDKNVIQPAKCITCELEWNYIYKIDRIDTNYSKHNPNYLYSYQNYDDCRCPFCHGIPKDKPIKLCNLNTYPRFCYKNYCDSCESSWIDYYRFDSIDMKRIPIDPETKKKHIASNKTQCPLCKSKEINSHVMINQDSSNPGRLFRCSNCYARWEYVYKIKSIILKKLGKYNHQMPRRLKDYTTNRKKCPYCCTANYYSVKNSIGIGSTTTVWRKKSCKECLTDWEDVLELEDIKLISQAHKEKSESKTFRCIRCLCPHKRSRPIIRNNREIYTLNHCETCSGFWKTIFILDGISHANALTRKERVKYDGSLCPYCKRSSCAFSTSKFPLLDTDNEIELSRQCLECLNEWVDIFKMSYAHIKQTNTRNKLSSKEKENIIQNQTQCPMCHGTRLDSQQAGNSKTFECLLCKSKWRNLYEITSLEEVTRPSTHNSWCDSIPRLENYKKETCPYCAIKLNQGELARNQCSWCKGEWKRILSSKPLDVETIFLNTTYFQENNENHI